MKISEGIKTSIVYQYFGQTYMYKNEFGTFKGVVGDYHTNTHVKNESFVLFLKPYTAISIEDAYEVGKISDISDEEMKLIEKKGGDIFKSIKNVSEKVWFNVCQFLQSKGYDIPQYLLGGKTLEESGLAVYSTLYKKK